MVLDALKGLLNFEQDINVDRRLEQRYDLKKTSNIQTTNTYNPIITKSITISPTSIINSPSAVASPILKKELAIIPQTTTDQSPNFTDVRQESRSEERSSSESQPVGSIIENLAFLGIAGVVVYMVIKK